MVYRRIRDECIHILRIVLVLWMIQNIQVFSLQRSEVLVRYTAKQGMIRSCATCSGVQI
jgi:hypothetical protein